MIRAASWWVRASLVNALTNKQKLVGEKIGGGKKQLDFNTKPLNNFVAVGPILEDFYCTLFFFFTVIPPTEEKKKTGNVLERLLSAAENVLSWSKVLGKLS